MFEPYVRELTKSMATDQLSVGLSKIGLDFVSIGNTSGCLGKGQYQIVRSCEGELPLVCYFANKLLTQWYLIELVLTLSSIPFHAVLRC